MTKLRPKLSFKLLQSNNVDTDDIILEGRGGGAVLLGVLQVVAHRVLLCGQVQLVAQEEEGGYEVAPLHQLTQRPSVVCVLCKMKACLVRQGTNVEKDLQQGSREAGREGGREGGRGERRGGVERGEGGEDIIHTIISKSIRERGDRERAQELAFFTV